MATKAKLAKGVQIKIGDGGGSEVFTLIPEVTNWQAPGLVASSVEVTSMDSTAKEFIAGLKDGDTASFDMNYVYDSATQAQLRTDCAAGTKRNFRIELNDAATPTRIAFAAIITAVPGPSGGPDQPQVVNGVTLKVTGDVTVTAGTP